MGLFGNLRDEKRDAEALARDYRAEGRHLKHGNQERQLEALRRMERKKKFQILRKDSVMRRKRDEIKSLERDKKRYAALMKERGKLVEKIRTKIDPELRRLSERIKQTQKDLEALKK